jgi:hypothetical protein
MAMCVSSSCTNRTEWLIVLFVWLILCWLSLSCKFWSFHKGCTRRLARIKTSFEHNM